MTRSTGISSLASVADAEALPAGEGRSRHPTSGVSIPDRISSSPSGGEEVRFTPSKPSLAPPEWRLFETIGKLDERARTSIDRRSIELDKVHTQLDAVMLKNAEKLRENAEKSQKGDVWTLLRQIGSCILAAISTVFGFGLIAAGGSSLIGGAMIASGILMAVNLVMSEAGGWDWVAERLASENEDLQKKLKIALPTVIGVIAAGMGMFGTVNAFNTLWATMDGAQQTLAVANAAANLASGVGTIGEAIHSSRNLKAQAAVTELQRDMFNFQQRSEKIWGSIKQIAERQSKVCEQAAEIVKLSTAHHVTAAV